MSSFTEQSTGVERNRISIITRGVIFAGLIFTLRGGGQHQHLDTPKRLKWIKRSLILMAYFYSINFAHAQCNPQFTSAFPELAICNAPIDLTPFVSPSPSTGCFFLSNGVITGSTFFDPGASGTGTFNIEYHPASFCTTPYVTQTIQVVNTNVIDLLANGSNTPKIVLSGIMTCSLTVAHSNLYNSFRWFKNGLPLGVTTPYYVTNDMGTYSVIANGCTSDLTDEIEVTCDCHISGTTSIGTNGTTTTLSSQSFNGVGGIGFSNLHTDYVFHGDIVVPTNVTINFNNANVRMAQCSKIIIKKGAGTNGGKIISQNSTFTGCDKWKGFFIEGEPGLNNSAIEQPIFEATSNGCEISDCYKALYAAKGGKLKLDGVNFENNENNITLRDYVFEYSPILKNLNINGCAVHVDFLLTCVDFSYSLPTNSNLYNKMIYMEDVNEIDIKNCNFIGITVKPNAGLIPPLNSPNVNAIELYRVQNINVDSVHFDKEFNAAIYGRRVDNRVTGPPSSPGYLYNQNYIFNNYYLNGDFNYGFYFKESSFLTLGFFNGASSNQNRFNGNIGVGTYIHTCSNIKQYGNIFNSSTFLAPTSAGGNIGIGVQYTDVDNFFIQNCIFQNVTKAVTIKNCITAFLVENNILGSSIGAEMYGIPTTLNTIANNRFVSNSYGLVISPDANPLINAAVNFGTGQMPINISCNYFKDNDFAIVGSGNLMDQGNTTNDNGNKWTNNNNFDLLWDNSFTGATNFSYYSKSGYSAGVNSNEPNVNASSGSLIINGINTPVDFTPASSSTLNPCWAGLMKTGKSNGISNQSESSSIKTSNPISNELIISGFNYLTDYLICFDAIGKSYILSRTSFSENASTFNTQNLSAGIYFISINNQTFKIYKL